MTKQMADRSIRRYVTENIPNFHQKKLDSISRLNLKSVLSRKNPYLLRAKGLLTPRELVKAIADAHLSSQEETLLGSFLEGLAIFICRQAFPSSRKSTAKGIDLEFENEGTLFLVTIKSGPNWGNSSQIRKMEDDFKTASKIYRQGRASLPTQCVNGCCYGKQTPNAENKGHYLKLCGQRFWNLISGDAEMYRKIIEPIGERAHERNVAFQAQYEIVIDKLTEDFREQFCSQAGTIDWKLLVEFVSGSNGSSISGTAIGAGRRK